MTLDISQFHQTFFEESIEGLDIMENGLLNLDIGAADEEIINTIFRSAHSMKGGSSTFGFKEIAELTHVLETLLDEIRDGHRNVSKEIVDVLLESVDCLREMMVAAQSQSDYNNEKIASIHNKLNEILGKESKGAKSEKNNKKAVAEEGQEEKSWKISFKPYEHLLRTGNEPLRIFRELRKLGDLTIKADTTKVPPLSELDSENCYLSWELILASKANREEIAEIFEWVEDDCELSIVEKVEQRSLGKTSQEKKENESNIQKKPSAGESSSIRVSTDKVDDLINMVGELVITQSMISQFNCDVESFDVSDLEKLHDGLMLLERNTRELQESVMKIRMLPISFVFSRFPRMVRDISLKLNKKIELKTTGDQTELDKTVMEKIGDPLVHLVRNSLDHGIETPEERVAAGKPETGTILLNAYHKGGSIMIEVIDDGAGLNKEKIRNKAIERGLIDKTDQLGEEAIYDLLFQPGFSTADVVSDVSGRGVGMDVVRKNVRALGGNVEVSSTSGKGSSFTIRLPLTLAILDGQLIRVGKEIYIISLVSIIESLQINEENVNSVTGKAELYKVRDEYIPIVRMHEVFGVMSDSTELNEGLLVIVEGDGKKVGLFVDELLGQQQVVIKSLETNYKRLDGVSGATILGDGTVSLILDVDGLIDFSNNTPPGDKSEHKGKDELAVA